MKTNGLTIYADSKCSEKRSNDIRRNDNGSQMEEDMTENNSGL
jgi:hypothetical protein